jgi:hypothetical protein
VGSLILCATEEEIATFLQRLPNNSGQGGVEHESLAPYRYLSQVAQRDRYNSLRMLLDATATANTIMSDSDSATTHVSPSLMSSAPFTGEQGIRPLERAGDTYCATSVSTVKNKWESKGSREEGQGGAA